MTATSIKTEPRELTGRETNQLRDENIVPATVYGPKTKAVSLQVGRNELIAAYKEVGSGSLIDLVIGDKTEKVLIKEIQWDPIRDFAIHVDFYQVDMTKPVSATVDLQFIGGSAAVKELGGVLVRARDTIEVRGLPDKLVPFIEVDISSLNTFDDVIHVKDLNVPEGLELDIDPERAVALVNPPRVEEEPVESEDVEGEEGAEGEEKTDEEGKEAEGAEGEGKEESKPEGK